MSIRIDKYLKLSRLVKRRTIAQEMVEVGAIRISGRKVKSSTEVKVDDLVEIAFPRRLLKVLVLVDDESYLKRKGAEPYRIVLDEKLSPEEVIWG